jgi:DNA-directed RNA polymerase subunit M/transcription elongation factor TFIIS
MNADHGPLTDIAGCKRCGALKVHKKMAQTRSADEGATAIFTCPKCGFGWNEG